MKIGTAKGSIRQRPPRSVSRKNLEKFLPISVQKSYFMLSNAERDVLNRALEKYRPGHSEPILVGGDNRLKPALRLMTDHRDASDAFPADNLNSGVLQLDVVTEIGVGRLSEPFMQLNFGVFRKNDAKNGL
jgi:hypothetical protein